MKLVSILSLFIIHVCTFSISEEKIENNIKEKILSFSDYDTFLEIRETTKEYKIDFFEQPAFAGKVFTSIKAGSIIKLPLSAEAYIEREKNEINGGKVWREIDLFKYKRPFKKIYFLDSWNKFKQVDQSSLGVPLTVRALKKFDKIMLYKEVPLYLENDCNSEVIKCIDWYEAENQMNLIETRFVYLTNSHGQGKHIVLFYKVRVSYYENNKLVWGDYWVLSDNIIRLIDIETCDGGECVSQDLLANNPEKVASFFKKIGITKKVAHKEQVVGSGFFLFHGEYEMDELGYNRWIDTLAKKYSVPYNKVPALSLFDVRPTYEFSLGTSYQRISSDDSVLEKTEFDITGVSLKAKGTFPLFLDFEIHAEGTANIPLIQSKYDLLFAFDATGDFLTPIYSKRGSQYVFLMGLGFNYRSFINAEAGVGYSSLIGLNMVLSYYSSLWQIYLRLGTVGRNIKPETNGQEASLKTVFTHPWFAKRGLSLGADFSYFRYFDTKDERQFDVLKQLLYLNFSF